MPNELASEPSGHALADLGAAKEAQTQFRHPVKSDGQRVWRLVRDCAPLDENSMYCNLLLCSHFAQTCIAAERNEELVGWISAYRPPEDKETIFVWQVAVSSAARGEGLGKKLLSELLACEGAFGAKYLKTTITKDNAASWRLFSSLAKSRLAPMRDEPWFDKNEDFGGQHDTEHLVTIGPL
ncbi:diaminobutyrate acetyltransferase [Hyphococcus flavus]|uniref:L-2,4-diaminobutyric acid acetyltransferase n=1 Tax=Hyphococcus flavus TaxID=1866326 RepID=A0AAE9ZG78_9PROT|nr:diaminobutyrate acetyltransferase [Hyphococcus flavus]WDI30276.1 diaminobutyrate acetyltransferase [Hyphococcus flavus]